MLSKKTLLALMLGCWFGSAASVRAEPLYRVQALPSGTSPNAINHAGHIVGDLATDAGNRGFIWSNGQLSTIGTLGGGNSTAMAINELGQVTGYAELANGLSRAYLYTNGSMSELNLFGQQNTFGIGLNDAGQVVGQTLSSAPAYRAFLYSGGSAVDLGSLGGDFAYASDINNLGQVVGVSALNLQGGPASQPHAFLYANGAMLDLGTLGGSSSNAVAINDGGQIVGHAWVDGNDHAFLYEGGVMTDLGTLGGRSSFARGINSAGLVVGQSDLVGDVQQAAFLYANGAMLDLHTLIDPALGWSLSSAAGINDRGEIAAWGCRDGNCSALLLERAGVVPEPQMAAMLLAGLGLLGWRKRSVKRDIRPSLPRRREANLAASPTVRI